MTDGTHAEAPPQSWPGHYYDGRTSTKHLVTVTLAEHGLTVQRQDAPALFWQYEDVTQTQGEHAGEPIRLERGAPLPEAVVIEDSSFPPALQRHVGHRYRRFRFPVSTSRRVVRLGAAFATSLAAVGAIVLWGVPALADLMTPWVPISWEVALGKATLEQMVSEEHRCTNDALRKHVNLLMARLVDPSKTSYRLHLTIVDSPMFNAYALPGGEIVVFRPLLQATRTQEELAGVLAHEAQHVLLRHTTKSLLRDLSLATLIGALFGDVTGIGALAIQTGRTLSTLHYSRDMEEQADREGVRLLQYAHFNPAGMIQFFETMKNQKGQHEVPAYLSTHPQTDQRIAQLKTLLGRSQDSSAITSDVEWKKITALCHK